MDCKQQHNNEGSLSELLLELNIRVCSCESPAACQGAEVQQVQQYFCVQLYTPFCVQLHTQRRAVLRLWDCRASSEPAQAQVLAPGMVSAHTSSQVIFN